MGSKIFEALCNASLFFISNQNILKRGKISGYVENDFVNASLHSDTFFQNVGYKFYNIEYSMFLFHHTNLNVD